MKDVLIIKSVTTHRDGRTCIREIRASGFMDDSGKFRKTAASSTPQAQFIKELILQDLSHAERGVLSMLLGENDVQSAAKTVTNQKTNFFRKLGLKNTNELIHLMKNW